MPVVQHFTLDWKEPDFSKLYSPVFQWRIDKLREMRQWAVDARRLNQQNAKLHRLKLHYRENPGQFIYDWGMTYDPREAEEGRTAWLPFILFKRQIEWLEWIETKRKAREPGICDKSRDGGLTWLAIAYACTVCLFSRNRAIGFGSRKEDYVDKTGDPKSIFWKGRHFVKYVPQEFRGTWNADRDAPHMRISFPDSGSVITGEAGKNIGRGDRTTLYFVDESAHLEQQELVDLALSATTNSRIDISSVSGMNNSFARRRWGGKVDVFTFHWRDDPRRDDVWYRKKAAEHDPVVMAQEYDIDYMASVEGVVIPSIWVRAAVDAHLKLGLKPTGQRMAALDVADQGRDKNAMIGGQGFLIDFAQQWTGKGIDIFQTVQKSVIICTTHEFERLRYDMDGLGAGVRGDARVINERRHLNGESVIPVEGYRGSAAVMNPELDDVEKGVLNKNRFLNRKAQAWWVVRKRFLDTYRWVDQGITCDPDKIISISSHCGMLQQLIGELCQVQVKQTESGKLQILKSPDGASSPNLADALVIRFNRGEDAPMMINENVFEELALAGRQMRVGV